MPGHAPVAGDLRRLHPWQDRSVRPRCGGIHEPHVHQSLGEPEAGPLPPGELVYITITGRNPAGREVVVAGPDESADLAAQALDGLGMLLHQAVPGFERWFGQRPDVDDATRSAVLSA